MINKKHISAFTLVELIVVIVIISILGTLAFLSFSQKSSSARDTLRKYDLSIIKKSMGNYITVSSANPAIFIDSTSANHTFSTGSVYSTPLNQVSYDVGTPNKPIFGDEAISDPVSGDPYIIGYTQGEFGAYYQVSATLETGKALVEGIYYTTSVNDLDGIIKDPNGTGAIINNGDITPY